MNLRRHATPQHPGIQLAPLVDVLLLLLIFFLMTWNAARTETELDVKIPKATAAKEKAAPNRSTSRPFLERFRSINPRPSPRRDRAAVRSRQRSLPRNPRQRKRKRRTAVSSITRTRFSRGSFTTWRHRNTKNS